MAARFGIGVCFGRDVILSSPLPSSPTFLYLLHMPIPPDKVPEFKRHFDEANRIAKPLVLIQGRKSRFTFFKRQRANKAIKHYKRCLEIAPDNWQAMWLLAKLYQAMGEGQVALDLFKKAVGLENDNPDVAREASISAMEEGEVELALGYSAEAVRRGPENPGLLSNHALHLMVAGRDAEALERINKAVQLAPEDDTVLRVQEVIEDVAEGRQERPRFDEIG